MTFFLAGSTSCIARKPTPDSVSRASPLPPTTSPTATLTPSPPPATPTRRACLDAGGEIRPSEFDSLFLPHFYIYLPPCYAEDAPTRYPSLYLIHGQIYDDEQWIRLGIPLLADRLIAKGEIPPMIIVFPYDKVSWKLPDEDDFGSALAEDLVPYIDAEYRTIASREFRGIGGISRGGGWAIHDTIFYDLFGALGGHSPALFYGDKREINDWLDASSTARPRIYLDIGDADTLRPSVEAFENALTEHAIPHTWHLYIGEHTETYWQAHIEEYLRWYGAALAGEMP